MKVIKKCLIVVSLLALFSCEKESEQNSFCVYKVFRVFFFDERYRCNV